MMVTVTALIVAGYVLGAIPFGALIARRYGVDILSKGSGNIGATNVHRVIGKTAGLVVSLLDTFKGLAPAGAAWLLLRDSEHVQTWALVAGMSAVLGHCFSPFLRFKGGKGIATGFGALLGSTPLVACCALVVFIVVTILSRYVSLASILATASVVVVGLLVKDPVPMIWAYVALLAFVIYKHRGNVQRLLTGTERKFSLKGGGGAAPAAEPSEPAENASSTPGAARVGES